jgi:hypothetical protein
VQLSQAFNKFIEAFFERVFCPDAVSRLDVDQLDELSLEGFVVHVPNSVRLFSSPCDSALNDLLGICQVHPFLFDNLCVHVGYQGHSICLKVVQALQLLVKQFFVPDELVRLVLFVFAYVH